MCDVIVRPFNKSAKALITLGSGLEPIWLKNNHHTVNLHPHARGVKSSCERSARLQGKGQESTY